MKEQETKPKTNTEKSVLDRFQLFYERTHPDKYISPTAGQPAPWYERWFSSALYHSANFVSDIIVAVKSIIKEIK